MTRDPTISTRLGLTIAAGVPVLVLVSMGPVAGLTGAASVLVWSISALIGFFMAVVFVDLAGSFPHVNGGIGVLAAQVLGRRRRSLRLVCQWSYWFGWSPALAINGVLVGTYIQQLIVPEASSWTVVSIATIVLAGNVMINHFGLRSGAWVQLVLVSSVSIAAVVLVGGALLRGRFDAANLIPLAPPSGWSSHGWVAVAGGLFIAGWSAYGAELALTYGIRYRTGVIGAVRALVVIAIAGVAAYSLIPLLLVGVIGIDRISGDPAAALTPLVQTSAGDLAGLVLALLIVALVLGLNMVTIGSSWTLYQMAHNGDAWPFLARLNRHGVPGNALRFDMAVNIGLLVVVALVANGQTAEVPIALLAAANVGYFVSVILALIAAWQNRRESRVGSMVRIRSGLMTVGLVLAGFNVLLLASAGLVWGWANIGIGVAALVAVVLVFTWGTSGRQVVTATAPPACLASAHWAQLVPVRPRTSEGSEEVNQHNVYTDTHAAHGVR